MTFVIAHRGSAESDRENTLDAFAAAARLGAGWVELDVRSTADSVPVVLHDRRLPDGRAACDLAASELPGWLPTLEEALATCASHHLGVVVEVKELAVAPTVDGLLRRLDQLLVVSSFHPVALELVADVDRALLVAPGMDAPAAVRVAASLGCSALHPHGSSVDAALVGACRKARLDVVPWTVNEPRHLRRMADLAVTAVITDDVTTALGILRSG